MASNGNWLQKLGHAIKVGAEYLASPKGQAVIAAGEGIAEVAFPPSAPVIALVNVWLERAGQVEAKAEAAADLGATATNEQKAAAAIASVTPDVTAILQQNHLTPLTPEQLKIINDAVVAIARQLVPLAPAA